ncbi:4-aminobutyrate transaminase [Spizellomyces punctatus DAOM BR117]|uniref:4-aminobutyrate transaminase n=1 Tax=Spizellomyces punctatus (strain DAOM BR117) TaxID=645134 RepID=A0A0L0HRJ8_SPIPD|nr:4-aminobutyrate transaminase [Spizellomyces punctatus DAOM BR117]KND03499.1 4-aminobutyrate transaminase [Spizellomyces punctatus DAOM BR117]|eukprot:XP_016611538.1 4-aminobutyrate transaminase [Spizellomyces punctatus DAOM BR117]
MSLKSAADLAAIGRRRLGKGVSRITELVWERGQGSWLYSTDGQKFLDFTCGIGVTNLGHCHPAVTKAAQKQCGQLVHAQCNLGYHHPQITLMEKLLPVMPHKSLDTFIFVNSGSEAVEASIKLARHATKKQNIIVMQGAFHGRTVATMAMSRSKTIYSAGFGPLMPGVFAVPFPYHYHHRNMSLEECCDDAIQQLKILLKQQSAPGDTAALIIEPVLGEGGYVPVPKAYFERLQDICEENKILLIADEVQSGFGRTGKYFAVEHSGVRPDIMVMAKGIANGYPLSAIVSRKDLMDTQTPGSMGGTYSGNAVACAAGVACADVMQEERILDNVNARGAQLTAGLEELRQHPKLAPLIGDIRGLGLMIALEFSEAAPANFASQVQQACIRNGMIILTTSVFETLRFIPPLTISENEMRLGLEIFKRSFEEAAGKL